VDLEALGFFPALTQLVGDFGDQNNWQPGWRYVERKTHCPQPTNCPVPHHPGRLNNIGQHARASSVLVRLDLDAARGVAVSVRDDGQGFDPGQLSPVAEGAGHFGLRQMRERILDLGGTLDIRTRPAREQDYSSPCRRSPKRSTIPKTAEHRMPPIRILIADDTPDAPGLAPALRRAGGFSVVAEANNGAEAVALACTAQPDVILLDIVMPAWTACKPSARSCARPLRRIIALTMYRQEQYMLDAIRQAPAAICSDRGCR